MFDKTTPFTLEVARSKPGGGVALALDNPLTPIASVNSPVITVRAILLEPNNGVVVREGVFMSVSSQL